LTYPAAFDVETPDRIDNWRPLVHWLLAIPHAVVMNVLGIVGGVVAIISWFTIVFTGKLSDSLADTQAMVLRYSLRTAAYVGFLHTEYPPFEFTTSSDEPGGTPVSVTFTPQLEDRNRLTVGLRFIWIIPAAIFAAVILLAAAVVWFVSIFVVLFTGKWNDGMREFVVKALRLTVKVNAYGMMLTDEYPPFSLED
jgi:hypothetical protein